jgi:hypothetical protein
MRVLLLFIACLLASCATPPNVTGQYAIWFTQSDVLQITALMESRHDILKPIHRIAAEWPFRAEVLSGSEQIGDNTWTRFTVAKTHGSWKIVSPIQRGGMAEVERVLEFPEDLTRR